MGHGLQIHSKISKLYLFNIYTYSSGVKGIYLDNMIYEKMGVGGLLKKNKPRK
jgi:hypothetical protein